MKELLTRRGFLKKLAIITAGVTAACGPEFKTTPKQPEPTPFPVVKPEIHPSLSDDFTKFAGQKTVKVGTEEISLTEFTDGKKYPNALVSFALTGSGITTEYVLRRPTKGNEGEQLSPEGCYIKQSGGGWIEASIRSFRITFRNSGEQVTLTAYSTPTGPSLAKDVQSGRFFYFPVLSDQTPTTKMYEVVNCPDNTTPVVYDNLKKREETIPPIIPSLTPTQTVEPTATPSPSPTPTETPTPSPTPDQEKEKEERYKAQAKQSVEIPDTPEKIPTIPIEELSEFMPYLIAAEKANLDENGWPTQISSTGPTYSRPFFGVTPIYPYRIAYVAKNESRPNTQISSITRVNVSGTIYTLFGIPSSHFAINGHKPGNHLLHPLVNLDYSKTLEKGHTKDPESATNISTILKKIKEKQVTGAFFTIVSSRDKVLSNSPSNIKTDLDRLTSVSDSIVKRNSSGKYQSFTDIFNRVVEKQEEDYEYQLQLAFMSPIVSQSIAIE